MDEEKEEKEESIKYRNKSRVKFRGRSKGALLDIKWSANGQYFCCVSDDRSVQLWKYIHNR